MLAFVVDNTSFDQDGLFPVEFLVWFTGFDQLCRVCPSDRVSIADTISWDFNSPKKLTDQI